LDSSLIHLSAKIFPWAKGGRRHADAVKLHVLLRLRGNLPARAKLTDGRYPDVKMLDVLPVACGCYYIMDRGYVDFTRLYHIQVQGGFFVVRSRSRLGFEVVASRPVDKQTGLRCDQTIRLTNPHSKRHYPETLRRIKIYDEKRKLTIVLLTNQFELPAATLAELYKQRWQVELFFKWIKQHLHIRTFLGQTPNAVYSQLWAAICVYLLLAILKKELKLSQSLYQMIQIINLRPYEQTPLAELLAKNIPETAASQNQNLFDFNTL
jgi:IS4 transposase